MRALWRYAWASVQAGSGRDADATADTMRESLILYCRARSALRTGRGRSQDKSAHRKVLKVVEMTECVVTSSSIPYGIPRCVAEAGSDRWLKWSCDTKNNSTQMWPILRRTVYTVLIHGIFTSRIDFARERDRTRNHSRGFWSISCLDVVSSPVEI